MIRIVILLAPFIISIGTAGLFCAGCNPAQDNIKSDIIIVLPNVPCRGCEGLVPEEGEGDVQSEGELRKEGEDAGPEGETEGEPVEAEGETGEGEIEGESAQYVTGVWACGEDTEFVYSFCENGTFTLYTVYYWGNAIHLIYAVKWKGAALMSQMKIHIPLRLTCTFPREMTVRLSDVIFASLKVKCRCT